MRALVDEALAAVDDADEGDEAASDTPEEPAEPSLDRDEMFHLLKSERRRRVLRYLLSADADPVVMRDLAEAVAAEEYGTTVDALGSDERQRVYITLYQSHLPQLDDAGVITYDQSRGHITTTPLVEEFEEYLFPDSTGAGDGSERRLWLAFAGFGLGVVTTLALVPVFGALATLGGILLVAAAVAIGVRLWRRAPRHRDDGRTAEAGN